jgi:hypothetical protein
MASGPTETLINGLSGAAMRISARGPAWSENSDLTVFRTGPASRS